MMALNALQCVDCIRRNEDCPWHEQYLNELLIEKSWRCMKRVSLEVLVRL